MAKKDYQPQMLLFLCNRCGKPYRATSLGVLDFGEIQERMFIDGIRMAIANKERMVLADECKESCQCWRKE